MKIGISSTFSKYNKLDRKLCCRNNNFIKIFSKLNEIIPNLYIEISSTISRNIFK